MSLSLKLKKIFNKFGYDIKKYHPFYETLVNPLGIKTILDIGANDGVYAQEMTFMFPEARIYAFEPLQDCFKRLSEVSKQYPSIVPLPYALGNHEGKETIQKSTFHPSSSLLKMTDLHTNLFPKTKGSTEEKIEIKKLDPLENELEIKLPFFVKIDVQGYEDKVIEGGVKTLKKASLVLIETSYVELYKGQPLTSDIIIKMKEIGFNYFGSAHTHYNNNDGKPLYEDSIFINTNTIAN